MKVLVLNSYGRADKGDAALLAALIEQVQSFAPDAQFAIAGTEDPAEFPDFEGHENVYAMRQYAALDAGAGLLATARNIVFKLWTLATTQVAIAHPAFSFLAARKLAAYRRAFREADMVLSVGGGYFNAKDPLKSTAHILFVTRPLNLAKKMGKFVAVAPVSVGPFTRPYQAGMVGRCFDKLDLVLVRENISFEVAQSIMKVKKPVRAVDSGFDFNPVGEYDLRKELNLQATDKIIAMTVRKSFAGARQAQYEKNVADFIALLARDMPDYKVVFMPQCTAQLHGDDDRAVARRICAYLPEGQKQAIVIEDDLDYRTLKLAYQHADYVIGTRFHSVIFALPYDVPALGLEYEHKTRGIMRELGLEHWIIKVNELSGAALMQLFTELVDNRDAYLATVHKTLPPYIEQAKKAATLIQQAYERHLRDDSAA